MGLSQALNGSLHVGAGQNLPTRTIAPTFQASAKWLRQIHKDERLNIHLTDLAIKWQFNLSRALLKWRSARAINLSLQECLQ